MKLEGKPVKEKKVYKLKHRSQKEDSKSKDLCLICCGVFKPG
jgi:hypothetical protein